jgi:beta-galactosidase
MVKESTHVFRGLFISMELNWYKNLSFVITLIFQTIFLGVHGQSSDLSPRERIKLDNNWTFALGHASDNKKDFNHATAHFTYFAKTGYGDGAAAKEFDDRAWRKLNLPHDWCVELPFNKMGSSSHGFNAIGRNFPENSIGWYRKKIFIPESDLGKKISVEFDGIHRNSIVWINGFYVGTELSGNNSFCYDITDYIVYGADNVIAVRVDATIEEGWYYEGAGIYRHVWLTKTNSLHVSRYGNFVTTELKNNSAVVTSRISVINETNQTAIYNIEETIIGKDNKIISTGSKKNISLDAGKELELFLFLNINDPVLWSLENPFLHTLKTTIHKEGKIVDQYETRFGIRTVRFDAKEGFFLNGKNVKIVGTNNHQDHAGVGTAIPDALQEFRIMRLKEMGSNAIRTSHNPPTPEFLDACDRLGMLVLDENRLMGINEEHFRSVEELIKRDRNHPSIFLWSLGNEEWHIEGDIRGARIAASMQKFAKRLDSSRAFTIACSGGWDTGIGMVTEVMGYNYLVHGDIDVHHAKFPWQSSIGTEESNTIGTRGIYETDDSKCHLAYPTSTELIAERGWKYYNARPFLSGIFYWTGFDYRGEPHPYGWPAVTSQFGIIDLCGFPKDIFYYMKSWWSKEPVLHIASHWNREGKEGQEIPVVIFSNCDQIELFLNNKSLGKKEMPLNGHLNWNVQYKPGILMAQGFKSGKKTLISKIETSGNPLTIELIADRTTISKGGEDLSVITIRTRDTKGLWVPIAENEINFSISGPGKIIGVGNGNPSSHEPEQFHDTIKTVKIINLKELSVNNLDNRAETAVGFDDIEWKPAFGVRHKDWKIYTDTLLVVRGSFNLPAYTDQTIINLFTKSIVENQSVYVNGKLLRSDIKRGDTTQSFLLDHSILRPGKNEYAIVGKRFKRQNPWEEPNTDPGLVQLICPTEGWKRKLFNGLAQIIIQSDIQAGELKLSASSPGLKPAVISIQSR